VECDILIHGGAVLAMDSQFSLYDPGYVAVRGGKIVGSGGKGLGATGGAGTKAACGAPDSAAATPGALKPGATSSAPECGGWRGREVVDARGTIVMPGYVNTHTHVSMSPFRGAKEDAKDRLTRFIFPLEARMVRPELVYDGALFTIAEMVRSGTTCFADMYYFEEEVGRAAARAGVRALVGETVVDFAAPDATAPYEGIARAERLVGEWRGHSLVRGMIAPHAPYTVDAEHLRAIADLAERLDAPIMMHIAEMDFEHARFSKEHGSVLRYLDTTGILSPRLIAAHMLYLDDADIQLAAARGISIAHCPVSNAKSGRPISPAWRLGQAGAPVGLGTDGPLSGNTMDMQTVASLYPKLQKVRESRRDLVPARDSLFAATLGGARVLGLGGEIGSLETGKRADLQIVDLDDFNALPVHDWYSTAVYSLQAHNVRDTMVAGSFVMRNRKLRFADETELKERLLFHARASSGLIQSLLADGR